MRALQVLSTLNLLDGGAASVALHATIAKQRSGVETSVVFALTGPSELGRSELERAGVAVRGFRVLAPRVPGMRRLAVAPGLAWWLVRHARRYDVIHVDSAWVLPSLAGVLAGRLARRPVVLTPHESLTDFDVATSRSPVTRAVKGALRRLYLRLVDLVVYSSRLESRDSARGGPARSAVVPHPVVDEEDPPAAAPVGAQHRAVGFLGRLDPKKNLDGLIRALAELPADLRLLVGGDGPPEIAAELRRVAGEAGVADRVTWLGWLSPTGRAALFERIDVLAMPSRYECFGMVAAEALVAGVPVVVSDQTGLAEIVAAHGGGLVCTVEPADIAAKLGELLRESRSTAELARAARAVALERLSYAAYGRDVRDLYASLV